ncbi:dihydroxyacetone kinase family protein [Brooklawnia cerclae]|uniref:Dihydroxyacetone kinase n=1 Tax=Brooklawnia cerclae TaxID=349934 RepID=A0ABX0SJ12_9ACTN|nr:dihydroxyacetone kinase family protein [Brooklawnia cerclae]NIH58378.1 dihydroxyacetone kinase [Brooklawnia cerclae]
MRKIINQPGDFVDEVVDGILRAHPDQLKAADPARRALVRADAGTNGRVGIVTGGGSGHLPLFLGYVGRGLASGCAVGNVFSSPSPQQIHAATVASDDGAGVLYLYGNYGGDVFNFDIAADLSAADGIRTTTVLGRDDILSAPAEKADTRRGVAGLFFAYKTAGAAAERGYDLDRVTEIAQRTCDNTRTMGVGLSPTILPAAGEPTFELGEGEMEIGIGIHGEPGQFRGPLETADQITDRFLAELGTEIDLRPGTRLAVLVNGLGATPLEELYVVYRRAHQAITGRGAEVCSLFIGEYATSLEMAGASLSLCVLDDELAELIDAPARSPFFQHGSVAPADAARRTAEHRTTGAEPGTVTVRTVEAPGVLRDIVLAVTLALPSHSDELRALDAALGDGDLGITVGAGARAQHAAVEALPGDAAPGEVLKAAGVAFSSANPSTFAALLGGALIGASGVFADDTVDRRSLALAAHTMVNRIKARGGAEVGDKTVIDVIDAVANYLDEAQTDEATELADGAVRVAGEVVERQAGQISQRGRAAWVGERSVGHRDPGSVAFLRLLEEIRAAVR